MRINVSLNMKTLEKLNVLESLLGCSTRSEVIRRIVDEAYERKKGEVRNEREDRNGRNKE